MTRPPEDLPRQFARTRRFTAGAVTGLAIDSTGRYAMFNRSGSLWAVDAARGREQRLGPADSYSTALARVCLRTAEGVSVTNLDTGDRTDLPIGAVDAARIDPTATMIAFAQGGALEIVGVDGSERRTLAKPDGEAVNWGVPEFAASLSMGRESAIWWSPSGDQLLVARVDESRVELRHLADPTRPDALPKRIRYPRAGTANAEVTLSLIALDGGRVEVEWDNVEFEYLVQASWTTEKPLFAVQSRDQRRVLLLEADPATGETTVVREVTDEQWVDVQPGTPTRTADGQLVWIERDLSCDTNRLVVGTDFVTPPGLQVAEIRSVSQAGIALLAQTEPTETQLYCYDGDLRALTTEPGVNDGFVADSTLLLDCRTMNERRIMINGRPIQSRPERPHLELDVELIKAGPDELRTAVFRPSWHRPGMPNLPVLLNPYAGPGFQLVMAHPAPYYAVSRWFAEQGFVVISADGRGTPGRGPAYERAVHGDVKTPALDDQIAALRGVAERYGDLDLERVAVRGWSYSGFLAAAAVIHRPDVFHAGIAGAPVTDQRQYDSYWKERFLGHPDEEPEAYRRGSLLPYATELTRPLLIVQGLADTNVWSSHALRLSGALSAAGKQHELIVLPGEGHSIADEDTIANLLYRELDFLQRSLRVPVRD
ncbi:prolyl oligopeptidase family serine peptidase [Kribbella yunnanensis]|uniref:Prolyl oligopeptidase family serine peptidase n=2 Tax=Kribbella yunnanensis TaxID=190194 RepID=A0ABP4SDT0_9ACTN